MKYKTVIEIVTDAEDKNEAMEIAGEYLSGNFVSGVDMKCAARRVHKFNKAIAGASIIVLIAAVAILSALGSKHSPGFIPNISGINAVQPPLKTSVTQDKKHVDFKKQWEDKQLNKALDKIK